MLSVIKYILHKSGIKLSDTPMKKVLKKLENSGVIVSGCNALEIFGKDGQWHTKDYAFKVKSIEIWEIEKEYEIPLKKFFPKATIKITDSFEEIKSTRNKFDFIVCDNSMQIFGDIHCEHFDIIDSIFNIAQDKCAIILNVIPCITKKDKQKYPQLFNKQQLEYRQRFYNTSKPENVTFSQMIVSYTKLAEKHKFMVTNYFFQKRSLVYYCVLLVEKQK
jgi:hypothetical protein